MVNERNNFLVKCCFLHALSAWLKHRSAGPKRTDKTTAETGQGWNPSFAVADAHIHWTRLETSVDTRGEGGIIAPTYATVLHNSHRIPSIWYTRSQYPGSSDFKTRIETTPQRA